MTLSARLIRLEHVHDVAERAQSRAVRAEMAQAFREDGDPRNHPTFDGLTPALQRRLAWLFDAWTATSAGFIEGTLPDILSPEPVPYVLFLPADGTA